MLEKVKSMSSNEKHAALTKFYDEETALLRRRRRKPRLDDFAVIQLIGKGGYGEGLAKQLFFCPSSFYLISVFFFVWKIQFILQPKSRMGEY